jgi:hypothetical protein
MTTILDGDALKVRCVMGGVPLYDEWFCQAVPRADDGCDVAMLLRNSYVIGWILSERAMRLPEQSIPGYSGIVCVMGVRWDGEEARNGCYIGR